MSSEVKEKLFPIVQDVCSLVGIPTATLGAVVSGYHKRRVEESLQILFDRLSKGDISLSDVIEQDDFIGVLHQYFTCVNNGVARENLDLLAQAIIGCLGKSELYPNKFSKYINILSTLTHDEIIILGTYINVREVIKKEFDDLRKRGLKTQPSLKESIWLKFMYELVDIRKIFKTRDHVEAALAGMTRTGLVKTSFGDMLAKDAYNFTVLLDEIEDLVDFTNND